MPLGSGLANQVGFADEITVGTPVAVVRFFEFDTESMSHDKNIAQGMGIRAGGFVVRRARRQLVTTKAAGDFGMDVPTTGLGLLLRHMLGSFPATPTQIGVTPAYQQIHNMGLVDAHSFTMQKGIARTDGTVEPFTYPGSKVTSWEISCQPSALAKLKLSIDSWTEYTSAFGGVAALQAAAYSATQAGFTFAGGTIKTATAMTVASGIWTPTAPTTLATVTGINVKGANALATDRFFAGAATKAEQLENGWRKITGEVDIEFNTRALYDAMAADTSLVLQVSFVGVDIGSGNLQKLTLTMPAIALESGGTPQTSGPGINTAKHSFTALDDGTNGTLQAVYVSTDTTV